MKLHTILSWILLVAGAPLAAQQDTLTRAQVTAFRARYPQQQQWEVQIRSGTRLDSIRRLYDRRLHAITAARDVEDESQYPLWYRAYLREGFTDLPTSGPYQYPRVAAQLLEWMVAHQDFDVPPPSPPGRSLAGDPTAVATVGSNINISNVSERHSESFVAVDYNDPLHLVASSNNITGSGRLKQFYSSDGGQSWNTTELPLDDGASFHSDPAVAWTPDGTAWAATLGIGGPSVKVQMYKSTDRGATWSFVATVSTGNNNDKELIWIDTHDTSPHKGNIYVAWDVVGGGMRFARSTDNGVTWSSVTTLSADAAIGAHLASGPSGELYVAWPDVGSRQIQIRKSTDGGATFGTVRTIATTNDAYEVSVPAMCGRKVLIYVTIGVDRSGGANNGHAYAVWDDRNGAAADPGCNGLTSPSNGNVYFSRSTDGGTTWPPPTVIHSNPSQTDQFNPWMDVDPDNGDIHVVYYDTRDDADRKKTRLYYVRSVDGGANWIDETQIATEPTDETISGADLGNQYGDYNGLAVFRQVAHPSWTDRRSGVPGGNEQIFTSRIGVSPPPVTATLAIELDPNVKLSVGATTTVRVTLTRNGVPAAGEHVAFSTGSGAIASVAPTSVPTTAAGIAEATVTGEGRGNTTVTAAAAGKLATTAVRVPTFSVILLVTLAVLMSLIVLVRFRPKLRPR